MARKSIRLVIMSILCVIALPRLDWCPLVIPLVMPMAVIGSMVGGAPAIATG